MISDLEISQMILDLKFHFANETMQLEENLRNVHEVLSKKEEELAICHFQWGESWLSLKKVEDRKDELMKKIRELRQKTKNKKKKKC